VVQGDGDIVDRPRYGCEDNIKTDFRKNGMIWATFILLGWTFAFH